MCLFQIGEISKMVPEDFKKQHIEIPWAEMRGLRNVEAHDYDNLDDNDIDFTFDSEAEKKWAEEIKDLSSYTLDKGYEKGKERIVKSANPLTEDFEYLWGKNYLQNSEIKFEYYLNGRHFSYHDFIMKDSYDNIHIFEVKSVNKSSEFVDINDDNQYEEKVTELKKC